MTFLRKTSTKKLVVLTILALLATVFFGSFLVVSGDVTSGLVGYWNFDNVGSYTQVSGVFNYAGYFDGVDDYIAGTISGLSGFSSFSVSFWMNSTINDATYKRPLELGDYAGHCLSFFVNNGQLDVRIHDNTHEFYDIYPSFQSNTFSLITLTYNGTYANFFANGTLLSENDVGSFTLANNNVFIGARYIPDQFFQGGLDDLRIYSRALSIADVLELYEYDPNYVAPTPSPAPIPPPTVTSNIFAGIAILMFMIIIGFVLSLKPYSIINIVYGILVLSVMAGLLLGGYLAGLWFFAFAGVAVGLICMLRGTDLL